MRYFEIPPAPVLSGFVQCFWYLEKDYTQRLPPGEWIFPDGTTDLIVQKKDPFLVGSRPMPGSFFVGPRTFPLLLRHKGCASVLGIRFHAHGAHFLFRQDLVRFCDQMVPLDAIVGRVAREFETLALASSPLLALKKFERLLMAKFHFSHKSAGRLTEGVRWLRRTAGTGSIAAMAEHVNLSRRQLERCLLEATGFPPKRLARIYRFDAVRDRLMLEPAIDLTELAHAALYHDQSHFIHDFRGLAGLSPTSFARAVAEGAIRFNHSN